MQEQRPASDATIAWLTHPVTCLALVLLLVNDHVLKAAWGTWWTGKFSDVAWLVVAPPLLATVVIGVAAVLRLPRLHARALGLVSVAIVGAVFVVVKSTAAGAALASTLLTALAGPSTVLRDPTDLLTLPALALAWAVARSASVLPSPEPRRGMRSTARWLVVLPVAVLATAATSTLHPEGTSRVFVVDGAVGVLHQVDDSDWYLSRDGSSWEEASASWQAELDGQLAPRGPNGEEVCVPASPQECFRAVGRYLGVERSVDGGDTWVADWAIPADVQAQLRSRYAPREGELSTAGVAVLPTAEGFRVYAANRGDGLAVRDEDGSWQRLGFAYLPDAPPVVPLPGEPTTMSYPVPPGLLGGVAAVLLALALSAPHPYVGRGPGLISGGALIAWGVAAVGVAALLNYGWRVVEGQTIGVPLIFIGGVVPGAVVGTLVALAVVPAVIAARRRGSHALLLFAATGVGVTLALAFLTPAALAGVVAAAVLAAGVVAVRRFAVVHDDGDQSA